MSDPIGRLRAWHRAVDQHPDDIAIPSGRVFRDAVAAAIDEIDRLQQERDIYRDRCAAAAKQIDEMSTEMARRKARPAKPPP
jgi:hypothetical protein